MKSRYGMTAAALVLAVGAAGCGADPNAPATSPSVPSPFFAQVDGRWAGEARMQPVAGTLTGFGGCVQADVNNRIANQLQPTEKVVLTIEQERAALTANLASSGTGLSCNYTGSTSIDSLSLHAAACNAPELAISCSSGVSLRGELVGSTAEGTFNHASQTITGTTANTYNLFDRDDKVVTGIVVKYDFSVRKQ